MGQLTEKQFKKAVFGLGINDKKHKDWIEKHPIEYTDEWIYEFTKYRYLGRGWGGPGGFEPGSSHGGLDRSSEGYYGVAMYDQDQ